MSHVELRYNLATKVMRNGVEVIVATDRNLRPVEAEYLRHLSSTVVRPITLAPHTLTNLMSMVLPTDHTDDGRKHLMSVLQPSFTTRTFYTTYNYPATISKDNLTAVSNVETTVTNVRTEELSEGKSSADIQPTAAQSVTLSTSPAFQTEVFPTAYTYWNTFLDGDQPVVISSTRTLSNTVVGAFDTGSELEPSEAVPSTNTYLKTVGFTRTITDGTDFQVISTKDLVTQVIVTDKLERKPTNVPVTTDVTKTYFVTYTYFSTYVDGDQTKVKSDVSVSSDVTIEKFYIKPKKTETKTIEQTSSAQVPTELPTAAYPFSILATKTYLTTFTYFTTLLEGSNSNIVGTKVSSRTKVVENTVTRTIPLRDLHTDYLVRLNSSLNRITGAFVTTATLKGGEKVKVTAHKNAALSSSYLQYEIKPTKTLLNEVTPTETFHAEKYAQEHLKAKPTVSKSSFLLSKTKSTQLQKSKIKPTKTFIGEATAEALVATEEEPISLSATPTVTFTAATAASSSLTPGSDGSADHSSTPTAEEATVPSSERVGEGQIGQPPEDSETDFSKKKPTVKHPNAHKNVTNLLNLNSLGINGMNVLGPVFDAMAELIHNNLNKNADSLSRRNDTASATKEPEQPLRKPVSNNINPLLNFVNKFTPSAVKGISEPKVKATTPRAPVYIPVGSFAKDSEFGESQDSQVLATRPENWHEKWPDPHAKNFEKARPHDSPITILEGGIPISPGQVITTNSDVIIGRPGETAPRPPTFAIKNNIPIDMKPPPLPSLAQFSQEDEDGFVAQHSMNQGVDLSVSQEELGVGPPRPLLAPPKKRPHQPHKNLRPHPGDRYRGSLKHKNPHGDYDSGTADLNPPPVPPPPVRSHDVHQPITINHDQTDDSDSYKISSQILPIPVHLGPNHNVGNYINPAEVSPAAMALPAFPGHVHRDSVFPALSEPTPNINAVNPNGILLVPTVAEVPLNLYATENPNAVDRSTGHQLLVKIQPSQVANIVIPHGSSTALILSDGKQHSLKGEVIDDPSPHPEPETVGFIGAEPVLKIENEDIAASFDNGIIPAEAGEIAQQSAQNNKVVLSNRPHLTTELIKIRPKPALDNSKGRYPYTSHSAFEQQPQHLLFGKQQAGHPSPAAVRPPPPANQDFSFTGNHRQTEHGHKNEAEIGVKVSPSHFEEQNNLKGTKNIYSSPNLQTLHFSDDAIKGAQMSQNYRKEEPNVNNVGHVKEVADHSEIHRIQNQQKFQSYLVSTGGLYAEQNKFGQRPHPLRGGNGIYVDISPPGHLPPRPNANLLHQGHSPEKQQSTLKEHLLNHQSGLVHDVPLNGQVQLGSTQKKENPLKEILISANTNKHDHIHDPKKKPAETKFIQNQTHVQRPFPELPNNLSPPPLSNENAHRIHRPLPLIPPHQVTAVQKYPLHPPVPKPAHFMIPPPQVLHRPVQNPRPEYPPRPIIPIGAGGPQQNYPNPRPEDILIVPHKNRPGSSPFNYVDNPHHDFKQTTNIPSDLDVSDTNDPVKTEYGEEIQESISRPLFPGQLPAELQKFNSSYHGHIHNHKPADDSAHPKVETAENTKSKEGSGATANKFYDSQQKPGSESTASISHRPFFSLIKKPSGFVTSNQGNGLEKTSSFTNHKESPSLGNHKSESFDPPDGPPSVKVPAKGGNIRIHAIGPTALPSGFVKNENAVDRKRPPATSKGSASNEIVKRPSAFSEVGGNKNRVNPKEESTGFPAINNQLPSTDASALSGKDKTVRPVGENKEAKDKPFGANKVPSGTTNHTPSGQNKIPGRREPQHNHQKEDITGSVSSQKFKTHSVTGQTSKLPGVEEGQDGPIQFHSNKVSTAYPIVGAHKDGAKKPQRHPIADVAPIHALTPSKRPSGFTTSGKEDNSFTSGDVVPPSVAEVKKPPGSSPKIPAGFTYKNGSDPSFSAVYNHNYGNKTLHFYEPKPAFDVSEDLDVAHNKPDNDVDKWFSSNFGGGTANADSNKKPSSKVPSAHRNVSSLPNSVLPADSDVHITLLPPPRGGDGRPKPEDVMGLSPPPLERPRRPPRPKPPFKFEIPTTPKPTLPPIAVENDFPPVRSPDFNKKPLKPQDIFPPRLPDNFIHHLPIRNHSPQRPITSLPIDTPAESTTEKSVYSESNSGRDSFLTGSEINGHSKPIADEEHSFSSMKPPPLPSNNRGKPASPPRPSTVYRQPPLVRITDRVKQEIPDKQKTVPAEGISPTSTLSAAVETAFHTKVGVSVTPTAGHPQKGWEPADVISSSETVFDPDKFSSYVTPTIRDFTTKKNIITTLVSTGSTTIFGDLYTSAPKQVPADKKPGATKVKVSIASDAADDETVITPTKTAMHTTTLTVTTTMTTVVHSVGHKPFTKTIVLTKTLISTVFNKVTETKTLVRPTTATIIQTHTVATTKTALVVPTAFHPVQTKYPPGGTLKPEIFVADPHAKDTMTISVSSSMNKHGQDKRTEEDPQDKESIYVFMSNNHPAEDNAVDVISHEDGDSGNPKVLVGGVLGASGERESKEKNKAVECTPGCKVKKNELCQRIEGIMKCVCRPGFARMFPDRPCRPTYTFNVQLMLEKFGSEQITQEKNFVQSASPDMGKLAAATKEGLERMIMQSDLRDIYHGVMVNGFQGKEKKTMVNFYVQLSENTDEAKLMEILKKTLQTSNYSLGGTELFADRESDSLYAEDFNECLSSKFHDCSENARCFNLKGTYTCSCKEGFTDLSENSQFPGRACSDTIGCEYCGYHGACYSKGEGQVTCECFQWYSGERCHINLKVLLIALVTIGAVLLALLLVCAVMACLNRSRGSTASRTNGSSGGYLRYRGPSSRSLDRRAMIADSSSESSLDNLPYVCAPPLASSEALKTKKKPALRHTKGPAPRPMALPGMEQRDRSVTVMIPRVKYRPMPPLSPHLTMSTFSPDKHLSKTAAQIATEQKLINFLDGNAREDRTLAGTVQNTRQAKEQQKSTEYKTPSPNADASPKPEPKKDSKIFEYEYKISNMLFTEETNSADKRLFKSLDDRFRRHSDSTHLNSDTSNRHHFRKYSAGALVSAGYEVSAKVGMHHLEEDTTEDEQSAIINTHTLKSTRSQFTTLNRTGDHKTMSEARSYDETTIHPPTRSLKTHYSGSSPSSRVINDEGHTMIERDLGSTFIMAESQLFKPEADRGSDVSNFDSL